MTAYIAEVVSSLLLGQPSLPSFLELHTFTATFTAVDLKTMLLGQPSTITKAQHVTSIKIQEESSTQNSSVQNSENWTWKKGSQNILKHWVTLEGLQPVSLFNLERATSMNLVEVIGFQTSCTSKIRPYINLMLPWGWAQRR